MHSASALPRLADLSRDIAGATPIALVRGWAAMRERNETEAEALLAPYKVHGTVVCSDTAGLSRLTQQLPLAVVLSRIAAPKAQLYARFTALGGEAIGTWVADNSETFFPDSVSADAVLAAALDVHHARLPVRIGLSLHQGTFYRLGGGLVGPHAEQVEALAEHWTEGGDTLVTPAFHAALSAPQDFQFQPFHGEHPYGDVQLALRDRLAPRPLTLGPTNYPVPWDFEMQHYLDALDEIAPEAMVQAIERRYLAERTVLLAFRPPGRRAPGLAGTLDGLVADAAFQAIAEDVLKPVCKERTGGGALVLAAFNEPSTALDAALTLRARARDEGLQLQLGMDRSPVYRFPMSGGATELAGDAVNQASKLAEDVGKHDTITLTQRAAAGLTLPPEAKPAKFRVSGIDIHALCLP